MVTPETLADHVEMLAGEIGERNVFRPEALAAAADYISATWQTQGYQVKHDWHETDSVRCSNLEITKLGSTAPAEILLVGAHYDSVRGSPGANDNGSGVAALLELSRLLGQATPTVTVRFVAFVNEEPPFFMRRRQGSAIYAAAARARGDDIRLMVALETIGYYSERPGSQSYPPLFGLFYPDAGNFLGLVSNFRSRKPMRRFAAAFQQASDFPLEHIVSSGIVPGVSWSDHRSFWKRRYRAFMVTDTAFYRYPHYHRSTDTADKLNYPSFARAVDGLYYAFLRIAREGFG